MSKESGEEVRRRDRDQAAEEPPRVAHFPQPAAGFNPRAASAAELRHFGLPARPGRDARLVEREYWDRTFTGPLTCVSQGMSMASVSPASETLVNHDHRINLAMTGGRRQRSENWSGAFVTPAGGGMFTHVRGLWTVPTPNPPPNPIRDRQYRCSVWVGLDGQRRYLHSSLPQIGSAQFATATSAGVTRDVFAWWQWWHRYGPSRDYKLTTLDVCAGDVVSADVTVVNRTLVRFFIMNVTRSQMYPVFQVWAPKSKYSDVLGEVQVMVSGATAEWVTERPMAYENDDGGGAQQVAGAPKKPRRKGLYELPDYDEVVFTDCHAIARNTPASVIGRVHQLVGSRCINMYTRQRGAERTKDISVAKRLTDTSLKTTYRAP